MFSALYIRWLKTPEQKWFWQKPRAVRRAPRAGNHSHWCPCSAFDPTGPSREEGWDVVLLHTAGNVLKYRISVYLYFCILKHRIKNQTAPEHPSSCV